MNNNTNHKSYNHGQGNNDKKQANQGSSATFSGRGYDNKNSGSSNSRETTMDSRNNNDSGNNDEELDNN